MSRGVKRDPRPSTAVGWDQTLPPLPAPSARLLEIAANRPAPVYTFRPIGPVDFEQRASAETRREAAEAGRTLCQHWAATVENVKAKLAHIDAHPHRDPRPTPPWSGYNAHQVACADKRVAEMCGDVKSGVVRLDEGAEVEPDIAPIRKAVPIRIRPALTAEGAPAPRRIAADMEPTARAEMLRARALKAVATRRARQAESAKAAA